MDSRTPLGCARSKRNPPSALEPRKEVVRAVGQAGITTGALGAPRTSVTRPAPPARSSHLPRNFNQGAFNYALCCLAARAYSAGDSLAGASVVDDSPCPP